jgi:hypothetical protein
LSPFPQVTFFSAFYRSTELTQEVKSSFSPMSRGKAPHTPRSVLDYLRDMAELCRMLHRPDLERHYRDAWEISAQALYGKLPPRRPNQAVIFYEQKPRTKTVYQLESIASPLRKIIARDGDTEILECGHRSFRHVYSGESDSAPPPKRRRCHDCRIAATQKKQPSSSGKKTKEALA